MNDTKYDFTPPPSIALGLLHLFLKIKGPETIMIHCKKCKKPTEWGRGGQIYLYFLFEVVPGP